MQLHRAGEFPRARDHYRQATQLDAANVAAWLRLAEVEQALGNFVDAERNYARALALAPSDPQALIGMGDLLRRLQRYTDSAGYLEQALSLGPESADALDTSRCCASNRRSTRRPVNLPRTLATVHRKIRAGGMPPESPRGVPSMRMRPSLPCAALASWRRTMRHPGSNSRSPWNAQETLRRVRQ
jgi:tetratricopeptide (TPR) repeat protein